MTTGVIPKKKRENLKIPKKEKKELSECNAIQEEREIAGAIGPEKRSSEKEHRADALALRAEERRDKLRKAAVRSKYSVIRRYLNGATRLRKPQSLHGE